MVRTPVLRLIYFEGFSALRVFALTGRNWFLAPAVFVLSLGPVIVNFVWHTTYSVINRHWFHPTGFIPLDVLWKRPNVRLLRVTSRPAIVRCYDPVSLNSPKFKLLCTGLTWCSDVRALLLILQLSLVDALVVVFISRLSITVADLVVIVVTWITTYRLVAASASVQNTGHLSFSGLLLRDGTLYFMWVTYPR